MKFGFVEDFRNPLPWRRPAPDLYRAILEQVRRAEEIGYDNVWLTEHHFTADEYNPSLLPTAAAIAAATERIRIGTFVLLLPFQHPVRVAEDATCVDILSNGRFDLGVGQGYSREEFDALCMPRQERSARLAEGVRLIRRLWSEERVTFDGKFVRVKDLSLSPRPVQRPHPPVVIGGGTAAAFQRAVRHGNGWYGFALNVEAAARCIEGLRAAARALARPAHLGELEISVTPAGKLDADAVRRFAELGVHRLIVSRPAAAESDLLQLVDKIAGLQASSR